MALPISQNVGMRINQFGQFKQLIVGAGNSVFKAQGAWVWAGSATPNNATFSIYLPTGALTTTGTINASAGSITGDLTVTGSLFSDDGSTFQTKLALGKISFLKNDVEKAFIKTASDSASLQCATGSLFYITKSSGIPIMQVDQLSNLSFNSTTNYIAWGTSGTPLKLTGDGNKLRCSGSLLAESSYFIKDGGTDYEGASGTFNDKDGNVVRVRKGLITNLTE